MLLVALVSTGCVTVQSSESGFSMGGRVHVEKGETARDEIVVLGGSVRIDGEARRDVVVIGGSVTINGVARGDVVAVAGSLRLGPDARVGGDVVNVGGTLNRSPGADISGEVVNVGIAGLDHLPIFGLPSVGFGDWWGVSPFRVMWRTTQLIYWLLLALLTVALVGDRVSSAAHSISREPIRLGAIGFVGFFALLFLMVLCILLSILLIGIPFLMALLLGWWLAYIFGMVAVFQVIGHKVSGALGKHDGSQLGLVLIGALVLGVLHYFPILGGLLWALAALVGLGAVFATRFGTNRPWVGDGERGPGGPPAGAWIPAAAVVDDTEPFREAPIEPPAAPVPPAPPAPPTTPAAPDAADAPETPPSTATEADAEADGEDRS
jgi:hypothetical protein